MEPRTKLNVSFLTKKFDTSESTIKECIEKTSQKMNVNETIVGKSLMESCSPRFLRMLSGPDTFYMYPDILGKRILLLGEHHNTSGICDKKVYPEAYEIHDWLYDMTLISNGCLDILAESFLHFDEKGRVEDGVILIKRVPESTLAENSAPMYAVWNKFLNFQSENARFHMGDLRLMTYHVGEVRMINKDPLLLWRHNKMNDKPMYGSDLYFVMEEYRNRKKYLNT